MRAVNKKILVEVKMNQKSALTIKGAGGVEIDLQMEKQYDPNGRHRNAVLCTVLDNNSDYDYIEVGDTLLVHHNFFDNLTENPNFIAYNRDNRTAIFAIPSGRNVFCRVEDNGAITPLCHNMIVERLRNPIKTKLIYVPDTVKQEHDDRVRVLAIAPEIEGIKPGQTVLIYKMADYEICYNWQKQEKSVIKVWGEEIIGIVGESAKTPKISQKTLIL